MRTKSERRHNDWTKAIRKQKLAHELYVYSTDDSEWYNNLHQYSKNKIHCSCPMCSTKTKNKGKRRQKDYSPSFNPKISLKKRLDEMDYEIENEI